MTIGCLRTEANNYKPNTRIARRDNPERLSPSPTPLNSRHLLPPTRRAAVAKVGSETVLGQFQRTVNLPDAPETGREVVRLPRCGCGATKDRV